MNPEQNIQVKYFDINGDEIQEANFAVKAEVFYFGKNNEIEKIDYYHIVKQKQKPHTAVST